MTDDAFAPVRGWFAALNAADMTALGALYADDAEFDGDEGIVRGREAIQARFAALVAAKHPALDGGARRRVRTIGQVETGFAVEWVGRETRAENGVVEESAGYGHFVVEDGRIVRHREVVRLLDAGAAAAVARPSVRRYPDRPVVGVGAVIVSDGRVVLIKRRFEPLAGQWSLPGGTLELGETLEAGVAREILEETGLEVEVGPVVEVFDRILLDPNRRVRYHFVLVDYLCRPVGGTLSASSDVADAALVAPEDVPSYRMTPKAAAVAIRGLEMARAYEGRPFRGGEPLD
jgi:ADP-ribose pyrophosphatase YjhB (NUDIX family)/ketosteroid isomerase-like protein